MFFDQTPSRLHRLAMATWLTSCRCRLVVVLGEEVLLCGQAAEVAAVVSEEGVRLSLLDQPAVRHHQHAGAQLQHRAQAVRDLKA